MMTPSQRYQADLDAGTISADPHQQQVVASLQRLFDELLRAREQRAGFWGRLRARFDASGERSTGSPNGIYLWGGVGRGKTYLMDILCDCLPSDKRLRTHFYRFMQSVHAELRALQGIANPLERVADGIANRFELLCFDEFFVLEIGDAMILAGLLDGLFRRGVVLVTTSNIDPDGLYANGLQRSRFLPAIALIKQHTEVLHIADGADYRLRTLSQATLYHHPSDAATDIKLMASFRHLAPDTSELRENQQIEILQRNLKTRCCADDVVWFEFSALCDGPRSAFDYVEIAKLYHAVILSAVPQLDDAHNDQVRRFVNLVDELYERRVKLIMAAAVALDQLYIGKHLAFEFERTRSRLIEMQSYEYLGYEHRAG